MLLDAEAADQGDWSARAARGELHEVRPNLALVEFGNPGAG
jgi:hypothetical protein